MIINALHDNILYCFQVKNEGDDFGWGVVVNFSKKSNVKVKYTFFPLEKYIPYCFF